jgi:hypothetical protein
MNIAQKVALLFSRRELILNGEFATDVAGWTSVGGTQTWVAGALRRDPGGGAVGSYQDVPTVPGRQYRVVSNWASVSGTGSFGLFLYTSGGFTTAAGSTLVSGTPLFVTATSATTRIYLYSDGTRVVDFFSVSMK